MASRPPSRFFFWLAVCFSFLGVVGFAYAQTSPTPAAGVLMYNTTFEGDPWNPPTNWGISQSAGTGSSYSLQTNTPRTGSRALRMTLTRNTASDFRTEISGGGSRVPLSTSLTAPTPVEQWLGYSMRLVAPYPTDTILGETLTQWHNGNTVQGVFQSENNGSEGNWSASPVLSLRQTTDGRLTVENRFSPYSPLDPRRPAEGGQYLRAGLETRHVVGKLSNFEGVWSDWVWHVVWDWRTTGGTGRIELWNRLPGGSWVKQIDYSGPVGVNDYTPTYQGALPYLKMGIYKSQWKFGTSSVSSRSIEFDNIKMYRSGGSFSQVAPSGTPTPPKPTTDTTAPSTPIGISVTAVSPSQIKLSWTASTDNVRVTGYRLERCKGTGCTAFTQLTTVTGTTYSNLGLLANTSYTYRVRAVDAAGNLSGYSGTSGVTTLSGGGTTVSTSTVFSTTDAFSGNTINWQPLTTSRWGVLSDEGNARYALKTTSFSPLSGNRLGEYTLVKGKTYADFTLSAKVRTTENLTTNPGADYNVLFGFQDAKNYYYFMFNSTTSFSQLFKVVGGTRITLADATNLAIPDTAYHTVKVQRSGSTITVFFDGAQKLQTTDTTFMTGRIGIGGYNDAAMWDDIRVTGTVVVVDPPPVCTLTTTTSANGTKWFPGHYFRAHYDQPLTNAETFLKHPESTGLQYGIDWSELEGSKGQYNFSKIDEILTLAKKYGKKINLKIEDRDFGGNVNGNLPPYMTQAGCVYQMDTKGGGLKWWDATCVDHFIDLYRALAKYNCDTTLASIMIGNGESALAGRVGQPGYSDEAYITEYTRALTEVKKLFPNTLVLIGFNFMPKDGLQRVAATLEQVGGSGFVHPDTTPGSLMGDATALEIQYQARGVPTFAGFQDPQVSSTVPNSALLEWAVNTIHAPMWAWNHYRTGLPSYRTDLVAYMSTAEAKTLAKKNIACPSRLAPCVTALPSCSAISSSTSCTPTPTAPTATFSALSTSISAGGTSKLTWTSRNAMTCALSPSTGVISTAGSITVSPTQTTTYTLVCTGSGGAVTKSVTVTVQTATGTTSISRDELPTSTQTIRVTTQTQLTTAIQAAKPGDHIVLANGEYDKIIINKQGTADLPIVIRAENILRAHLRGGFELTPNSKYIWIYGLDLKDSSSKLQGENHVIRRVRIWPPFNDGKGSNGLSAYYGSNARIDYCEIRLYTTDEVLALYGKKWDADTAYRGIWSYFREGDWFDNLTIERCLLTGGPHDVPYSSPNSQFIEADGSVNVKYTHDIKWRLRNIFGDVPRDRTLIDLKHRGITLEKVHIISPQGGAIQVRDGNHHNILESRFDGATISVNGEYNIIENTTASAIKLIAGTIPWDSNVTPKSMDHRQAYRTRLSYTSGPLSLGYAYEASGIYPALQTTIESHSGTINRLNEQGTIISQTSSVVKKTPVILNSKVVGPNAPWVGISGSATTPSPSNPAPLAPTTATFSAVSTSISAGGTSKLTWTSKNAVSCALAPATGMISTAGSVTVSPTKSTTYTLICTGSGGTVSKSVTVTVKTTSVTPTPSSSGSAKLMYQNDFETGWGDVMFDGFCPSRASTYKILKPAQGDSVPAGHQQFMRTTAHARSGTYAARVALDPKYACWTESNQTGIFKIRSEIMMGADYDSIYRFTDDTEHWYGVSIYVDGDNSLSNPPLAIMAQVRPGDSTGNYLRNNKGTWEYLFEGTNGAVTPTGSLGPISKGAWTDFVFHLSPSSKGSGVVEVWVNGIKKYSNKNANYTSTSPNTSVVGTAKSGAYYGQYGENYPTYGDKNLPFIVYIDSVKIAQGANGYSVVDPSKGANGLGTSITKTLLSLTPSQRVVVPGYFGSLTANALSSSGLLSDVPVLKDVGSFARRFYNDVLAGMDR